VRAPPKTKFRIRFLTFTAKSGSGIIIIFNGVSRRGLSQYPDHPRHKANNRSWWYCSIMLRTRRAKQHSFFFKFIQALTVASFNYPRCFGYRNRSAFIGGGFYCRTNEPHHLVTKFIIPTGSFGGSTIGAFAAEYNYYNYNSQYTKNS